MYEICAGDCYDWWNSPEAKMIGHVCRKVVVIGQNRKVVQNVQELVEFALIVATATSQLP